MPRAGLFDHDKAEPLQSFVSVLERCSCVCVCVCVCVMEEVSGDIVTSWTRLQGLFC